MACQTAHSNRRVNTKYVVFSIWSNTSSRTDTRFLSKGVAEEVYRFDQDKQNPFATFNPHKDSFVTLAVTTCLGEYEEQWGAFNLIVTRYSIIIYSVSPSIQKYLLCLVFVLRRCTGRPISRSNSSRYVEFFHAARWHFGMETILRMQGCLARCGTRRNEPVRRLSLHSMYIFFRRPFSTRLIESRSPTILWDF